MKRSNGAFATNTQHKGWRARYLSAFSRDEDGSVIILTILLLITMLVVGGMAVDFMRFEARRATLQSVSDRAVLAAASLRQTLDAQAVVEDYFEKAGFDTAIVGTPIIVDSGNSRTVSVNSRIDMNTFYLRLIGMDILTAHAESSATEGVGKVEISLVLDISGSMNDNNKFRNMQEAAIAFAEKVLHPDNGGQVSLTIIPYAGGTNVGREMFDILDGSRYADVKIDPGVDGIYDTADDVYFPQISSCMELTSADWASSAFPSPGRDQMPHFIGAYGYNPSHMDVGWCPMDKNSIQYAMADADDAKTFINALRMQDGTGTHYAMKYALAALDPASRPAFAALNALDTSLLPEEFANRPAAWDDGETKKIIVLMTDGEITPQWRPHDNFLPRNITDAIGTPNGTGDYAQRVSTAKDNVARFNSVCNLAKESARNIQVYTVAFGVSSDSAAADQMRNCASYPSMFFLTSGAALIEVFSGIADRITDLRLNL